MKKQMKRTVYEAPRTERIQVQLEAAFCAGSAEVRNPDTNNGRIDEQEINTSFTATFESSNWE
jgi:hypothetical protein